MSNAVGVLGQIKGLDLGEFFHIGVTVADIDSGMRELTAEKGLSWTPVLTLSRHEWNRRDGLVHRVRKFALSTAPPHVEIIETLPGTIWERPGFHHICFWGQDMQRDVERLESLGFEAEVMTYRERPDCPRPDPGKATSTYHSYPGGAHVYVEFSSASNKGWLEQAISSG